MNLHSVSLAIAFHELEVMCEVSIIAENRLTMVPTRYHVIKIARDVVTGCSRHMLPPRTNICSIYVNVYTNTFVLSRKLRNLRPDPVCAAQHYRTTDP